MRHLFVILIVIVSVTLVLVVSTIAIGAGRRRSTRRSNHGKAMERLEELAHRYGVDEDSGPAVRAARHVPPGPASPQGTFPDQPPGTPRHAAREHGVADSSSSPADPMSWPRHLKRSSSIYSVPVPHVDGSISGYPGEGAPTPSQPGNARSPGGPLARTRVEGAGTEVRRGSGSGGRGIR